MNVAMLTVCTFHVVKITAIATVPVYHSKFDSASSPKDLLVT